MLVVAVVMFFYSQAVIMVTPAATAGTTSFDVEVTADPDPAALAERDVVGGSVSVKEKSGEVTVPVTSTTTASGTTVGTVTITNSASQPQTLLATTQLQAENGVIVRTNERVIVPAGGSITVGVYPKDPATFVPIAPGRLTIIKLAPTLQTQIYGMAATTLTGEAREVKVIMASDVDRAKQALIDKLAPEIVAEAGVSAAQQIAAEVINAELVGQSLGASADQITVKGTVRAKLLIVNPDHLKRLIQRKVRGGSSIAATTQDLSHIRYELVQEVDERTAVIKVTTNVATTIDASSDILQPENLAGQPVDTVRAMLEQSDLVTSVSIRVSPYWRTTLPTDVDRIKVIVQ